MTLVVHDGEDSFELRVFPGERFPDHHCPCGGRVLVGAGDESTSPRVLDAALLVLLHSAPSCEAFRRLGVIEFVIWFRTGREAKTATPLIQGANDATSRSAHRRPAR